MSTPWELHLINKDLMLRNMKKRVYLDAAAAYPVRASVARTFVKALKTYGNPSAPHTEGQEASQVLEEARTYIAKQCGAKSDAVIFTSGASESNVLAIVGHIKACIAQGRAPEDMEVLYLKTQHASVIGAVEEVRALGVSVRDIPLHGFAIAEDALRDMVSPKTVLITLDVVCGETGTRFNTRAVRKMIDALPVAERPVLHVDATQAVLTESLDRTRLGADLITFDAQKIGGVRGIGALIAPRSVLLLPLSMGGGQERGLRSGTPSPALAQAFQKSLELVGKEQKDFCKRSAEYTDYLAREIESTISHTVINRGKDHAPHILNVSFVGRDTDYLTALLDERGFAVSTKSACETDAQGSRVVAEYTHDEKRSSTTLRISLHAGIRQTDVQRFLRALQLAVAFLDSK